MHSFMFAAIRTTRGGAKTGAKTGHCWLLNQIIDINPSLFLFYSIYFNNITPPVEPIDGDAFYPHLGEKGLIIFSIKENET